LADGETQSTDTDEPDGIHTVLVVGAGTMGAGIAQVVAEAGVAVTLTDASPAALDRGLATIERNWAKAVERGKADPAAVAASRGRLTRGEGLEAVPSADLIVEAIVENLDAKRSLFGELSALAAGAAILASNTSSISITQLAAASDRPERVVGMHFFNPVPVMQLVEVVRGERTSAETAARAAAFARRLGKEPVEVNDFPGFVSNRVLMPMINEAVFCLGEGVAGRDAIDRVMRLGMAHPMGPLALADLIGLDVCLDILETLHRELGDDKYRPAPLLRRLVAAGKLGRKSGEGFYPYEQR
jgi:3-hydroxybutyryl-CoA dehydrogenase